MREGVIEVRGDAVRFGHPLLASAVSSSALPAQRRHMHRRLAEVVETDEQQAKHLALGTEPPSEEVAATLGDAASRADERGAPQEAAELLELACRFTPDDDRSALTRRTLELAQATWRAGDGQEAIRLLDVVLRDRRRRAGAGAGARAARAGSLGHGHDRGSGSVLRRGAAPRR